MNISDLDFHRHGRTITFAALINLGLFAGPAIAPGPLPALAASNASEICTVTQAAFMAATKRQDLAYPDHIIPSRPMARLDQFLPSYVVQMGLDADELSDLISQQDKSSDEHFVPACEWKGKPIPVLSGSQAMRVGFSHPIFSSDSKLAVIEVSFRSQGVWGYGIICVLRRTDADWAARCIHSWIASIERDSRTASVSQQTSER